MKQSMSMLFSLIILFIGSMACKTEDNMMDYNTQEEADGGSTADSTGSRFIIRIGSKSFTATLLSNPAATSFKARLPMTVAMSELNGNEKLYNLPSNLPANASNPGTIQTGDLMLYGSSTIVLFYKTFTTPYSYTRLGRIIDTSGLASAAGSGNVTVMFEME